MLLFDLKSSIDLKSLVYRCDSTEEFKQKRDIVVLLVAQVTQIHRGHKAFEEGGRCKPWLVIAVSSQ